MCGANHRKGLSISILPLVVLGLGAQMFYWVFRSFPGVRGSFGTAIILLILSVLASAAAALCALLYFLPSRLGCWERLRARSCCPRPYERLEVELGLIPSSS